MVMLHSSTLLEELIPEMDEVMSHIEEAMELPHQVRVYSPAECAELGLVFPRAIAKRYHISIPRLLTALFNPSFPTHAGETSMIPGSWSISAKDLDVYSKASDDPRRRIAANRLRKRLYCGDEVIAWVRRHFPEWELDPDQLLHTAAELESRGLDCLAEYHLELAIEKQEN